MHAVEWASLAQLAVHTSAPSLTPLVVRPRRLCPTRRATRSLQQVRPLRTYLPPTPSTWRYNGWHHATSCRATNAVGLVSHACQADLTLDLQIMLQEGRVPRLWRIRSFPVARLLEAAVFTITS